MVNLQKPTNDFLDQYINKYKNDDRHYLSDQAIINLFQAFPHNKKTEDILLKISVINDLYSTNIFGTFLMAKHIQQLDIDEELSKGNPEIVRQIATGHNIRLKNTNRELNFYSFATKYCNWHNRESYSIYDSFVDKILMTYKRKDNFSIFKQTDLKDFNEFKRIIQDFIKFYGLTRYNLKEIDKFLWIYGKEMFPVNY
jgi:hypothetical protein